MLYAIESRRLARSSHLHDFTQGRRPQSARPHRARRRRALRHRAQRRQAAGRHVQHSGARVRVHADVAARQRPGHACCTCSRAAPNDGAFSDHGYLTPVTDRRQDDPLRADAVRRHRPGMRAARHHRRRLRRHLPDRSDGARRAAPPRSTSSTRSRPPEHADGALPYGSLMYDGTYLYGTTSAGGDLRQRHGVPLAPVAMGGDGDAHAPLPLRRQRERRHQADRQRHQDRQHALRHDRLRRRVRAEPRRSVANGGRGAIFAIPIPP